MALILFLLREVTLTEGKLGNSGETKKARTTSTPEVVSAHMPGCSLPASVCGCVNDMGDLKVTVCLSIPPLTSWRHFSTCSQFFIDSFEGCIYG